MKDAVEGETGAGDEQRGRDMPQDSYLFMLRCSAPSVHRCLLVVPRPPESDHALVVFAPKNGNVFPVPQPRTLQEQHQPVFTDADQRRINCPLKSQRARK